MYQFASVTRWAREAGLRARPVPRQAPPAPVPVRPVRAAAAGLGEAGVLAALDVAAVAAASYGTGPWTAGAARAAAVVLALAAARLYRARLHHSVLDDLPRLVAAVLAVLAAGAWLAPPAGTVAEVLAAPPAARSALVVVAVVAARALGYRLLRHRRRRTPGRAAIVVGCGDTAMRLADALRDDRAYGLAPVGFVGPPTLTRPTLPVLAGVTELERAVVKYKPLHLLVAFPGTPDADLVGTLRRCRRRGVTVHVVPRLFELAVAAQAESVRGIPLVRLRPEPMQLRRWAVKRAVDVCGAALGLLLLAPVLALCALAAKIEAGRHGVLFRQERITRDGRPFTILKFRSLTPSTAMESQVKWNINTDARLGPVGRVLRFSSLDELPQLWNVLRGDMSLVGPRPERPFFVEEFQRTYTGYADRHRVPTGITGWAQVNGLRGDTSIEERARFDNHYIENWSLGLDVKIMLRTLGAMVSIHRV